jgi:hypothetical protein
MIFSSLRGEATVPARLRKGLADAHAVRGVALIGGPIARRQPCGDNEYEFGLRRLCRRGAARDGHPE